MDRLGYRVTYNAVDYPDVTREYLGLIPEFFIHGTLVADTLETVADAMETDLVLYWGFGCIILVAWLIFTEEGL